jgi:hypothetical protein
VVELKGERRLKILNNPCRIENALGHDSCWPISTSLEAILENGYNVRFISPGIHGIG